MENNIIGYAAEDLKAGDNIFFNLSKGGFCKCNNVEEFKSENIKATWIKVKELYE